MDETENQTAPAEAAPEPADSLEDEVSKVLRFDPFPAGGDAQPKEPPKVDGSPPQDKPPQQTPADKPPEQQAKPAQTGDDPELLKAALAEKDRLIRELQGAKATVKEPEPDKLQVPAYLKMPEYNFNIPDQIVAGIESNDPVERRQALNALISGASRVVHEQVLMNVQSLVQEVIPSLVQSMIQHRDVAQRVYSDFYNTHKDLNDPALYPLVQNVAQSMMTELGVYTWSPKLRDAIANRVRNVLRGVVAPPAAQQQTFTPSQAARPVMAPADAVETDIQDTLFGPIN